jgi:spoIIIJ-associated protein
MSNAMKSTGKTVDEAVREALLRMGLRRDEVSVTVIQEARGGLLGLGRRDAVVEVAKKSDFDRDGRRRGSTRRSDGRRGGEGSDEGRQEARGARGGERRGGRRDERDGADSKGGDRSRRGGRGRSRGRGRDEETKDQPVVAEAQEPRSQRQETRPDASPQDARGDDRRNEDGKDESRRRRRRPRRRRKSSDQDEGNVQQQQQAEAAPIQANVQAAPEQVPTEQPDVRGEASEASEAVNDASAEAAAFQANVKEAPEQPVTVPDQEPVQERQERTEPEQTPSGLARAADLAAAELVKPFDADQATDEVELLTRVATSLMVKAGFQSRVTVTPGDYHQVKMVVDDRSAGVLIGRQGSTVDAVEHLIDRIATRVAGERVKFNLDINNYRLRREDGLLGATRRAMDDARQSGEPVFMEPAGGRERRIVHLEVAEADDLVTYTEDGEHGKFVVICKPEQVPAEHRDPEVHGTAPAAAEAPGEPRVDA